MKYHFTKFTQGRLLCFYDYYQEIIYNVDIEPILIGREIILGQNNIQPSTYSVWIPFFVQYQHPMTNDLVLDCIYQSS